MRNGLSNTAANRPTLLPGEMRLRPAHQDHRWRVPAPGGLDRLGELNPVHDRHHVVGDHQRHRFARQLFQRREAVAGAQYPEALVLQREHHDVGDHQFVIDHEKGCHAQGVGNGQA